MSRASLLILIGVLAILGPFSGLPSAFRTLVAIGLGAAVIGIGIAERSKEQRRLLALQSHAAPEPQQVPEEAPMFEPVPPPPPPAPMPEPEPEPPPAMIDIPAAHEVLHAEAPQEALPPLKKRRAPRAPKTMSSI